MSVKNRLGKLERLLVPRAHAKKVSARERLLERLASLHARMLSDGRSPPVPSEPAMQRLREYLRNVGRDTSQAA